MDDYSDIRERLSSLRNVTMPPEREKEITNNLQKEIEIHRDKKPMLFHRRNLAWLGSVSAAVLIAVVATISLVRYTPLSHQKTASHQVATVSIRYTTVDISEIKSVSQDVGVKPWIPTHGLPGDKLTVVKNGVAGKFILAYKNFWLVEQTTPPADPPGKLTKEKVTIDGTPGVYMTAQVTVQNSTNTFSNLSFLKDGTYIVMSNLGTHPGPISLANSLAIASSLRQVP